MSAGHAPDAAAASEEASLASGPASEGEVEGEAEAEGDVEAEGEVEVEGEGAASPVSADFFSHATTTTTAAAMSVPLLMCAHRIS